MGDVRTAIMDVAERRMRVGGLDGFSFRDIAAEIGIKSASVHYHFPTKETLAAAVVRRYTEAAATRFDAQLRSDPDPVQVWISAFRATLFSKERICPCAVLGAVASNLPAEVASAVKAFFDMCLDKMTAQGLSQADATALLSTLTGALVVAHSLGDDSAYDRATAALGQRR